MQHHHNIKVEENPFTYVTGRFGHYSRYLNKRASDWTALFLTYRTGGGVWYPADQPDNREIWVKIKSNRSSVDIRLDGEFGWSDVHARLPVRTDIKYPSIQMIVPSVFFVHLRHKPVPVLYLHGFRRNIFR